MALDFSGQLRPMLDPYALTSAPRKVRNRRVGNFEFVTVAANCVC